MLTGLAWLGLAGAMSCLGLGCGRGAPHVEYVAMLVSGCLHELTIRSPLGDLLMLRLYTYEGLA
jgi:hypothetical protein